MRLLIQQIITATFRKTTVRRIQRCAQRQSVDMLHGFFSFYQFFVLQRGIPPGWETCTYWSSRLQRQIFWVQSDSVNWTTENFKEQYHENNFFYDYLHDACIRLFICRRDGTIAVLCRNVHIPRRQPGHLYRSIRYRTRNPDRTNARC